LALQQADLFLNGAVPYCDFADTRQPLLTYLCIIPVIIASQCGISTIAAFGIFMLAILLVSLVEILFILRHPRMCIPAAGRGLVLLVWTALYFVVDWQGNVGQQEYWFVLLYMPYLLLRVLRYQGGNVPDGLAILLGIQAGIGVEFKPLFLFAAVNVELVLLFTTRNRRTLHYPEIFAILGTAFVYWLHWFIMPGAMQDAFFDRWVPMANYGRSVYNSDISNVFVGIVGSPIVLIAVVSAVAAGMVGATQRAGLRFHFLAMAAFAGMAFAMVFLQQKDWSFHYIPLNAAGLLCLAFLIIDASRRWALNRHAISINFLHAGAGVMVLCGLVAVWLGTRNAANADSPEAAALRKVVLASTESGDRVLVIAATPEAAYPMLVQTGRRPGSRYLYSFPIAFTYSRVIPKPNRPIYRKTEDAPLEERQFLRELGDDVARRKPQLIAIESGPTNTALPKTFTVFDYLAYVGWTDQISQAYEGIPSPEGWRIYERRAE
jgi:hypothetical protein